MTEFTNYLINGALIGLLYALIAMGFVVICLGCKVNVTVTSHQAGLLTT